MDDVLGLLFDSTDEENSEDNGSKVVKEPGAKCNNHETAIITDVVDAGSGSANDTLAVDANIKAVSSSESMDASIKAVSSSPVCSENTTKRDVDVSELESGL